MQEGRATSYGSLVSVGHGFGLIYIQVTRGLVKCTCI